MPREIKRLVIPVGSGMSLAGVLWGMKDCGLSVPVLGVRVGADPRKQLAKYAPAIGQAWSSWSIPVPTITSQRIQRGGAI